MPAASASGATNTLASRSTVASVTSPASAASTTSAAASSSVAVFNANCCGLSNGNPGARMSLAAVAAVVAATAASVIAFSVSNELDSYVQILAPKR